MNSLIYVDVYYISNLKNKKIKKREKRFFPIANAPALKLDLPCMPVVRAMYDFIIRHWLCMDKKFSRKPSTYNQKGSFLH